MPRTYCKCGCGNSWEEKGTKRIYYKHVACRKRFHLKEIKTGRIQPDETRTCTACGNDFPVYYCLGNYQKSMTVCDTDCVKLARAKSGKIANSTFAAKHRGRSIGKSVINKEDFKKIDYIPIKTMKKLAGAVMVSSAEIITGTVTSNQAKQFGTSKDAEVSWWKSDGPRLWCDILGIDVEIYRNNL